MSLLTLPNELLLIIAKPLGPRDLNHLLSTNQRLSALLTPELHTLARKPIGSLPSLHWGVLRNYLPLVALLLRNSTSIADIQCGLGWTALHYAAAEGRTQMVRLLLSHGATTTPRNIVGETALSLAAQNGRKTRFSQLLHLSAYRVAAESCPTAKRHIWADDGEHETIVRLLLEHGAEKDSVDMFGRIPLHWAIQVHNVGIVRVLLDAGADVNYANADGDTPLMWAVRNQREGALEIVAMLVACGADVGAQNMAGRTALHCVARRGFVGAAALLLEAEGVRLDAEDAWGRTALFHVLMDSREDDLFLILLNKGADYGIVDAEGNTALHWAASAGMVNACRALLERGVRWDVANSEGITAFDGIMNVWMGSQEERVEREEVLRRLFLEKEKQDKLVGGAHANSGE